MKKSLLLLFAVGIALSLANTTPAIAGDGGWCGNGYGDGYYFGFYNRRWIDTSQLPPYFSQFPPVYYSAPIARPYGWSPFALRPDQYDRLPTIAVKPKMVMNKHFKQKAAPKPSQAQKTASVPKTVYNPFFKPDAEVQVAARQPAAR